MAYARVDESGCCIRDGLIQVRVNMYLDPDDPGYDEHHVYVPDETSKEFLAGYKGEVDASGRPADFGAFKAWLDGLPHIWQVNPFVNHFVYVDHTMTAGELKTLAQDQLDEFLAGRKDGKTPAQVWTGKHRPRPAAKSLTTAELSAAETKLTAIKALGELVKTQAAKVSK